MANDVDILNFQGLQLKDFNHLLDEIKTNLQNIYAPDGEEINFESASPDGQFVNILSEMGTVVREIATEVYNSTSPSNVSGAVQDIRYQINYLYRKGGTFTIQNIDIECDRTVELQGLDASYNDVNASSYTVSDDAGNLWYLIDSITLTAGTHRLPFRAKEIGEVTPIIGTITNQNTIVAGIVSVNNSIGYTSLGENQETDEEFRIRREQSVSNASENNVDTIIGQLLQLDGVTDVNSWINNTNNEDETGTEGHTLWVIINGGANTEIADIIYKNIGGAETRGEVEQIVYTISEQPITIRFDRPEIIPMYIKIQIKTTEPKENLNTDGIKEQIVKELSYKIGQDASTSEVIAESMIALESNGGYKKAFVTDLEIANDSASATISTTSTSITNVQIDAEKFAEKIQESGSYVFTYTGSEWQYNSQGVQISDYGITFEGTPTNDDTITVVNTSSTWTNLLQTNTKADLFTLDISRIYINIEEI